LDAGVHPAVAGLGGLPYYDTFDMSAVDVLLISQYEPSSFNRELNDDSFHLDHAASLPYVIMKASNTCGTSSDSRRISVEGYT
jgi:cleavage and polyadenylation specificity factor subunit 3